MQGAQLKALIGVRLPQSDDELQAVAQVVLGLSDCMLPGCTPEGLLDDLRTTIRRIEAWWENRKVDNKEGEGCACDALCVLPGRSVCGLVCLR